MFARLSHLVRRLGHAAETLGSAARVAGAVDRGRTPSPRDLTRLGIAPQAFAAIRRA